MTKPCVAIFGATSAIAHETARIWAKKGHNFILVGRQKTKLDEIADDLKALGADATTVKELNFTDWSSHEAFCQNLLTEDNNISMVLMAHGSLGDQTEGEHSFDQAKAVLDLNFYSYVSLLTPIANYFEKKKSGTIAVISSVAGDRGRQSNYLYGTAKAAISTFIQGLRNRLYHHGVHVITIKPGFVSTPMTAHLKQGPLFAQPQAIAQGIVSAAAGQKDVVYLPKFWWLIMTIIKLIPERIFKRLRL